MAVKNLLAVFDLDGTLLVGNSMKMFTRRLCCWLLQKGYLGGLARALMCVSLRKMKLTDHRAMKWHLLRIADRRRFPYDDFAKELGGHLNPEMVELLEKAKKRDLIPVLVTAAPEQYAEKLGHALRFSWVSATKMASRLEDYRECRGGRKVEAIREDPAAEICMAVTDHADDLPLLEHCSGEKHIVNPSPKFMRLLQDKRINVTSVISSQR